MLLSAPNVVCAREPRACTARPPLARAVPRVSLRTEDSGGARRVATAATAVQARSETGVRVVENADGQDFERVLLSLRPAASRSVPDAAAVAASPLAATAVATAFAADAAGPAAANATAPTTVAPMRDLLSRLWGARAAEAAAPAAPPEGPSSKRVLVMFTATWCGPCSVVHKALVKAVSLLPSQERATVLVVDVERNHELASSLGIRSLPTLMFLGPHQAKGPLVSQGIVSEAFIRDALCNKVELYAGHDLKAAWLKM